MVRDMDHPAHSHIAIMISFSQHTAYYVRIMLNALAYVTYMLIAMLA